MSTSPTSKLPRKKRSVPPSPKLQALPDVLLTDESTAMLGEPKDIVAEVEARCSAKAAKLKNGNEALFNKTRARKLHEEADVLYFKGDYESALVLYHRAAQLNPGNVNHLVGARRASDAITASVNPDEKLGRLLRESRSPGQMSALVCPEAAARRARAIVAQSDEPVQDIPRILNYFDSRKELWHLENPRGSSPRQRSRVMQRQLNRCVKSTVQELSSAYESGDSQAVSKLSEELVNLVSLTERPDRNRIETYGFLASKQIVAGRHDKAVECASKMFFLARTTNDVVAMVNALVILGRVHINFGHIDALARVWERLAAHIETEKVPFAWLLHDIGRCHLELGNYQRALEAARRCLAQAEPISCKKWMIRGELLSGLALAKLGRYEESMAAFGVTMNLSLDEEAEKPVFDYAQEMAEQVSRMARESNNLENRVDETRQELQAIMKQEVEVEVGGEESKEEPALKRLLNVFQTLEKHLDASKVEEEEDEEKEEKEEHNEKRLPREVSLLLERTKSLRRFGDEPPKSMLPRPVRKEETEEKLALTDDEILAFEETRDAGPSLLAERTSVHEEYRLDSDNSSLTLDDHSLTDLPDGIEKPMSAKEMMQCLKIMERDGLLLTENSFLGD